MENEELPEVEDQQINRFDLPEPKSEPKREALRDSVFAAFLEGGPELFLDKSGTPFVSFKSDGREETWPLRSKSTGLYLRNMWFNKTNTGIASGVVNDVIDMLEAKATFSGKAVDVHVRIAHQADEIYVDLCDSQQNKVRISKQGWQVTKTVPVKFARTSGMLPLPLPLRGKKIDILRPLINVPTEFLWKLVLAWLLAAYSAGPYPLLIITGEQGSAKSFMCRVLRRLVDPSEVEVTYSPKESRDVMIAAVNSHLIAIDNVSVVPNWLSDLLCSIGTGAAYRERRLHCNQGDEVLFKSINPIIVNGIDFRTRDDLLDRAILAALPSIEPSKRMDERQLNRLVDEAIPYVLGAIFDLLVEILRELPSTSLSEKPRMADFALWVTAAEKALGWEKGSFMKLYAENRCDGIELALESDAFASALRDRLFENQREWSGTWKQLLLAIGEQNNRPKDWPGNPKAVAMRLRRLAPALRQCGIHWKTERSSKGRYYRFWMDKNDGSGR